MSSDRRNVCVDCAMFVDPGPDEDVYPCPFAERLYSFIDELREDGYDLEFSALVLKCPYRIIVNIPEEILDGKETEQEG